MGSRTAISRAKKAKPSFQKRLSRTSFKQIARAPDCFQIQGVLRISLDLFTQAADVNVHAARRNEAIRSPDRVEQLIPGKNAVWARSKVIEQPEFERAERYRFPRMTHAIRRRVNRQLADLNSAGRVGGRLGTAEQRLDARKQFAGAEGLGHVIVSSHLEPDDAVGFFAARREHENGQTIERVIPANLPADFQAGKFREHEIEKQQIGWRLFQRAQAGTAVLSRTDLKAFVREIVAD